MLCLSILHSRQAQTGRGQIVMGRRSQFWWLQVRDFGLFADFLIMEARSV